MSRSGYAACRRDGVQNSASRAHRHRLVLAVNQPPRPPSFDRRAAQPWTAASLTYGGWHGGGRWALGASELSRVRTAASCAPTLLACKPVRAMGAGQSPHRGTTSVRPQQPTCRLASGRCHRHMYPLLPLESSPLAMGGAPCVTFPQLALHTPLRMAPQHRGIISVGRNLDHDLHHTSGCPRSNGSQAHNLRVQGSS